MRKRTQFPSPDVSREEQHALAAHQCALEVLESVVHDNIFNILARVFGKKANLGELPAERSKHPTQNCGPLLPALVGKRELEVVHADPAQASMEQVYRPCDCNSFRPRQWPRQCSN